MSSTRLSLFYVLLLGAYAAGYAYLASVVGLELRPYFHAHGMQSEEADAGQALGYLVFCAVVTGLMALVLLCKMCFAVCVMLCCLDRKFEPYYNNNNNNYRNTCASICDIIIGIIILVFACLTAAHAWAWWHYFAAEDLGHLSVVCHGVAALLIANLVLLVSVLIVIRVFKSVVRDDKGTYP